MRLPPIQVIYPGLGLTKYRDIFDRDVVECLVCHQEFDRAYLYELLQDENYEKLAKIATEHKAKHSE